MKAIFIKLLTVLFIILRLTSPAYADSQLKINEFLVHPETGNQEWVEFYNPEKIDISGFFIDDDNSFNEDIGNSNKKTLTGLQQTDSDYPYFEFNSFLNNDIDSVVLFDSSGNLIDQYSYSKDPGSGMTIGRSPDGSGEFQILSISSKGQQNSSPLPTITPSQIPSSTPTKTPTPAKTPTPTKTPSPTPTRTQEAAISQFINTSFTSNPQPTKKTTPKPSFNTVSQKPTLVLGFKKEYLSSTPKVKKPNQKTLIKASSVDNKNPWPIISLFSGSVLFTACAIILYLKIKTRN